MELSSWGALFGALASLCKVVYIVAAYHTLAVVGNDIQTLQFYNSINVCLLSLLLLFWYPLQYSPLEMGELVLPQQLNPMQVFTLVLAIAWNFFSDFLLLRNVRNVASPLLSIIQFNGASIISALIMEAGKAFFRSSAKSWEWIMCNLVSTLCYLCYRFQTAE